MIFLLGTSHISPKSIEKIKGFISKEKPDCVAVELDYVRYFSMMNRGKTNPPGLFLKFLSWIQKKLGKMTGIFPGQEMLEAIKFSGKNNIPVYLIDQDFRTTVNEIQNITVWEKIKLLFVAFFGSSKSNFDLKEVPSEYLVKEAIILLKEKFPQMYKILVQKRNKYMASAIKELDGRYEKILVVVGAGHIEGLKKLLKDKKPKTIPW